MRTSAIDLQREGGRQSGFTLIELTVALVLASLLAAVSVPSIQRMSESMRYREAVRSLVTAARTAKRDAFAAGVAYDLLLSEDRPAWVVVPAASGTDVVSGDVPLHELPEELTFDATYASEVSPGIGFASIRFYPSGGSSGGDIDVIRPSGSGVRLKVDWLLANVLQVPVVQP